MLIGASAAERQKYQLKTVADYRILSGDRLDGVDETASWKEMIHALQTLNFTPQQIDQLIATCAAILHLGNVQFSASASSNAPCAIDPKTQSSLELTAQLLQLDMQQLIRALQQRTIQVRGESISSTYSQAQCADCRDSLIKYLYDSLFSWTISMINKTLELGAPKGSDRSIYVLDIFGYENFLQNYFEQMCINYANEKLQQHFTHFCFTVESKQYAEEGISFSDVAFIDNQITLDLIEEVGVFFAPPPKKNPRRRNIFGLTPLSF